MSGDKIRYLVPRYNKDGSVRWVWQPKSTYRKLGWRAQPLGKDPAKARAKALELNDELDRWRAAGGPEAQPVPDPARVGAPRGGVDGKHRAGTLGLLIAEVEASDGFKKLTNHTQRDYRWLHGILGDWAGDASVADITAPRVQKLYQAFKTKTPRKAQLLVTRLHTILEHGRRHWDKWPHAVNPAKDQNMEGGTAADKLIWLPDLVTAFVAKADAMGYPSIGDAIMLNEWCGQRMGDVLSMPADIVKDGEIRITQSKRGARVALPVGLVPHLVARLDDAARRRRRLADKFGVAAATVIVCEKTGRRWVADTFRHTFAEIRAEVARDIPTFPHPVDAEREAETANLLFMHLRHTAVVRLAEAGSPAAEISAITGHKLTTVDTVLEHYLIRTVKMAQNAFKRRLDAERNESGKS